MWKVLRRIEPCTLLASLAMLLSPAFAAAQAPSEWQASAWQLWRIDVDGTSNRSIRLPIAAAVLRIGRQTARRLHTTC